METAKIRVLLAEDHRVVREGLRALLSTPRFNIDVVGEAADGVEAVDQAARLQPDVVVMDLEMPRMGGVAAIGQIKAENPAARILVLTSFSGRDRAVEAVRAGATGFLVKDSSPDDLVQAITSVYHDQVSLPEDLVPVLWEDEDPTEPTAEGNLTERELAVLAGLVRGLSNRQIAEELQISVNTVRSHIRSILSKLNVDNRTQAAMHAVEHQLVTAN